MEEDSRFAVTSFPPCAEWGSADDAQQVWPESPCTSPILSDIWPPQEKPMQVKATKMWTREEPVLPVPYTWSTSIPSAAFRERVLRQTGSPCTSNGISQAKLLPSSKISISPNSVKGITRTLTQTPANPGITAYTESKAVCEKVSVCFALQLLLPQISTVAELKN